MSSLVCRYDGCSERALLGEMLVMEEQAPYLSGTYKLVFVYTEKGRVVVPVRENSVFGDRSTGYVNAAGWAQTEASMHQEFDRPGGPPHVAVCIHHDGSIHRCIE